MDLMQIVSLGGIGLALAYMGFQVYMRQIAMSAKQAEDNKDNTPKWLEFAGITLKGFDAVLEALRGFSSRFDADSRERESIAREHVAILAKLSETVGALNARIDAESATLREGHAANVARLDALNTIINAVAETALEARKEVKIMSDETKNRAAMQAEQQAQQHARLVETLTEHGLKLSEINEVVKNATVLSEGGLADLIDRVSEAVSGKAVTQLLHAMAETQPITPVQPDATNIVQNVTVNPETKEENTDDQP